MDPTTGSAAGVRALSSIASAALNRYRPVGVARCGSPEDRAQAYRRLLDSVADLEITRSYWKAIGEHGGISASSLFSDASARVAAASSEALAAVRNVQLCAPAYVIAAAEDAVEAARTSDSDACNKAQARFLESARHDLDYNPKRWNLLARRKEKKFQKMQAQKQTLAVLRSGQQSAN